MVIWQCGMRFGLLIVILLSAFVFHASADLSRDPYKVRVLIQGLQRVRVSGKLAANHDPDDVSGARCVTFSDRQ